MSELSDFQRQQLALTRHLRDPDNVPAPAGIEERRLAIYRELLFNNVEKLLASSFPVLRKLLDDAAWAALVRDYFATHRATTPFFKEVPQEFLAYLRDERGARDGDPAFLYELAHYEWVELAVSLLPEDTRDLCLSKDLSLLEGAPRLASAAWSLAYAFDVHNIGPGHQPATPPQAPTYLVVHRRTDDSVGFLHINAVTARLIELMQADDGRTGRALLTQIAGELNHPDPGVVVEGGVQILQQLLEHGIVLGVTAPLSGPAPTS